LFWDLKTVCCFLEFHTISLAFLALASEDKLAKYYACSEVK
jgi:hypothetical protein